MMLHIAVAEAWIAAHRGAVTAGKTIGERQVVRV